MATRRVPAIVKQNRFMDLAPSAAADATDLALIQCLADDGRMSAADMASAVGLSSDAVRDRLRRLLDGGVVTVVGSVNPATVGLSVLALVGVRVTGPITTVGEELAKAASVDFVACVASSFDLVAEVVAASPAEVLEIVDAEIRSLPQVVSTEIFLYSSLEKWGSKASADAPKVGLPHARLDEEELLIVDAFRADGRITYRDLAARTGISYPTARRKAIALMENGVIRVVTMVNRLALGGDAQAAVGVTISHGIPEVLEQLRDMPEIDVIAAIAGRFDLMLDVSTTDADVLQQFVHQKVRTLPNVVGTETFTYLKVLKLPFSWSIPHRP